MTRPTDLPEERDLRAEVDAARGRVDRGDEKAERVIDALLDLAELYMRSDRSTDAVSQLLDARRLARAEVAASRASPHAHLARLIEVTLALAEAQRASDDPDACARSLREVARSIEKSVSDPSTRRDWLERAASVELRARTPVAPAAPPSAAERYTHVRFGGGALIRREESGLRIRFDDGAERVLKPDRVTRVL